MHGPTYLVHVRDVGLEDGIIEWTSRDGDLNPIQHMTKLPNTKKS